MRHSRIPRLVPLLAIALLAASCDSGLTGLNENPNAPSKVTPQYLFPNGVTNAVGDIRSGGFDLTFTSLWAQHIAMDRFTDEDRYSIRPGTIDNNWSSFYSDELEDFATIIQQTDAAESPNLVGPALVMKSWTFGVMTDIWGDIPYSEANQGTDNFTPKYDRQQDIYNGLFADLTAANDMLTPGGEGYGSADPIYNGDATKWKQFANSLRLRFALRLIKVDPEKAKAEATAAIAAGVFTSNDDNALLRWPGDGTNDSPFFNTFRTRDDQHVSQTLVDTLNALSDPRVAVYADPVISQLPDTVYIGAPNGLQDDDAIAIGLTNTSRVGAAYRQRDTPSILMTYSEVLFDEAEAAARGWTAGDPAALYNDAIRASMQYNGIADDVTDTYLAGSRVAYNPATGLTQIALQKWIALFAQGADAYAEYRRSGVPDLKPGPAVITDPKIVARRLTYPLAEQSFNNANLQEAITAQGGASLNDRVWWDVP
ncbi:MAG TPA: SusD/RagB family nutrient-binding outer membrane lipoprotein [Gemmatimonadaceae bacterium]|nr:SusD/RagB family nutrient-binding outer membrane lipoprotein [Gemmatimonadaceae bacterium]